MPHLPSSLLLQSFLPFRSPRPSLPSMPQGLQLRRAPQWPPQPQRNTALSSSTVRLKRLHTSILTHLLHYLMQGLQQRGAISAAAAAKEYGFELKYSEAYAESIRPRHKPPVKVGRERGGGALGRRMRRVSVPDTSPLLSRCGRGKREGIPGRTMQWGRG